MINITKLLQAMMNIQADSAEIQALFLAAGEINEDPDGAFKLMTPESGLKIEQKDNSTVEIYCGLRWINYEDDFNGETEIADIVLTYDAENNLLTKAATCGVSFSEAEWAER